MAATNDWMIFMAIDYYVPFEKPIVDLERKIDELRLLAANQALNLDEEIDELSQKADSLKTEMFSSLSPYESTQISRHMKRPTTNEFIQCIFSEFIELHGDRNFNDDKAIVGGLAQIENYFVVMIGHQKGKGTKENIARNFGMARPEGYRKALRLMSLAERFSLPIITFVDTPGAYPGVGAEERGQSEAIAKNIMVMSKLRVPIITVITGEGGSGGALALAVANKVHMLEHSVYSVITPEGCASILFKDSTRAMQAAEALKLSSRYAMELGVIDSIIKEAKGGAHRSIDITAANIKEQILADLKELTAMSGDALRDQRLAKFLAMGSVVELPITVPQDL